MTISNFVALTRYSTYTLATYLETGTYRRAARVKIDSSTFKTLLMYNTLDGGYAAIDTDTRSIYQLDTRAAFERLYVWYPDANMTVVPAPAGTTRYTATFDPTQTNFSIQQGATLVAPSSAARFSVDLVKPSAAAPAYFITSGARGNRTLTKVDPFARHHDTTITEALATLYYGTNHTSVTYVAAPTATDSTTIATSNGSLLSTTSFRLATLTAVADLNAAATTSFTQVQLLNSGYGINSINASNYNISGYAGVLYQYYVIPAYDGTYTATGITEAFDIIKLVKSSTNAIYYQNISLADLAADATASAAYNKILNTTPVLAIPALNVVAPDYQAAYSAYAANQQNMSAQTAATSAAQSATRATTEANRADLEEDKARALVAAAEAAQKGAEAARDSANTTMWIAIFGSLAIGVLAPFLVSWLMKGGMGSMGGGGMSGGMMM